MRRNEQIRSTGTLIVLSCIQNCIDHGLCDDIVFTEVCRRVCSLKFFLCCCHIQIYMDGIQVVIQPNRSDVIREDLSFIAIITTIAKHDCSSQFFVQLQTINVVKICYVIEICNIDDIISMKCTLYEYSLRISGSTNKLEVAGLSLFLPLGISFCSESLDVSNINLAGSDSGNRTLMNFVHYSRNPTLITGNELRCSRTYIFVLREQKCYIALSV